MSDSFVINYNKDNNVTVVGYEIESLLLNTMNSPIATLNFNNLSSDTKTVSELFKGKIVPAGLFSLSYSNHEMLENNNGKQSESELLNSLNTMVKTCKQKSKKNKQALGTKIKTKTKRLKR